MNCPKCNYSNDDKYAFCLECGASLSKQSDISSEPPPTALYTSDKFARTEIMPPDKLPTEPALRDALPIEQKPPDDLPETVFYTPDKVKPTEQMPPGKIPPTIQSSSPRPTERHQNSPTKNIEAPPTVFYIIE